MNKKTMAAWALAGLMTAGTGYAVPMVEIVPSASTVTAGSPATVDVVVSGLAAEYVGAYDLTIEWDPSLLALQDVVFDVFLDGPADSLTGVAEALGAVNVFEVALAGLSNQSGTGAFRLFSLTFDALRAGSASLVFSGSATQLLGDANGTSLGDVGLLSGRFIIEPTNVSVPEPGTLALLCLGLVGMGWCRRRT